MKTAVSKRRRQGVWAQLCRTSLGLRFADLGGRSSWQLLFLLIGVTLLLGATLTPSVSLAQFPPGQIIDRFELSKEVQIEDDNIGEVQPHLALAREFLKNGSWDEAIETLRKIRADHGKKVIKIADRRYVSVRDLCHLYIASMPEEALTLYRERVDVSAEKWYCEGVVKRDASLLQRVVDTLFCSSYGDNALDALAQIALERGKYDHARRYWELISPLLRTADGQSVWVGLYGYDLDAQWHDLKLQFENREKFPRWLVYPDTDLDLASIRARLVLASILEGSQARARFELNIFRRLHGDAAGRLAGRRGLYYLTLSKLLSDSQTWGAVVKKGSGLSSSISSNQNGTATVSPYLSGKPLWQSPQPLRHVHSASANHGLAFFPLVVDGAIFYNNSNSVFALRAADGTPLWQSGGSDESRGAFFTLFEETPSTPADYPDEYWSLDAPRYSMTAHDGKLFVRLGLRRIPTDASNRRRENHSFLVCFDTVREGSLQWRIPSEDKFNKFAREQWVFEGPPAADSSNIYVGMRRGFPWSESYVACFDAQTGQLRWRTKVCEADSVYRTANNLVTLHEGVVYYNTNLGSIAALEADTGMVRWVYRYERTRSGKWARPPMQFFRGLNPCIYHEGLVIAGPVDCESIVALDAVTGQRAWQTVPLASSHLLGVGQGNVIATGRSVWWFNALTGKLEAEWPGNSSRNAPRGYGRGVLVNDAIYWPSNEEIIVFDQQLGPRRTPIRRPGVSLIRPDMDKRVTQGNLSVSGDGLLLATERHLFTFGWLGGGSSANAQEGSGPRGKERTKKGTEP